MKRTPWTVGIFIVMSALTASWGAPKPATVRLTALSGWFTIIWETERLGGSDVVHYILVDDSGHWHEMALDPRILRDGGGAEQLNRRRARILVETSDPAGLKFPPGELKVRSIQPTLEGDAGNGFQILSAGPARGPAVVQQAAAATGSKPYATLLCKYANTKKDPERKSYFDELMGSAYPGADHYFREVSYDAMNLAGSQTFGWYTLPLTYTEYFNLGSAGQNRLVEDCTAAADADVYFPDFVGINLMFSQSGLGNYGGALPLTLDGTSQWYGVTWISDWQQLFVVPHEMGHTLGLPHSSGPYGQTYDSYWDVMSGGGLLIDNTFGRLGDHTIAYHKDLLGWIPPGQKYTAYEDTLQTIPLERLALPTDGGTSDLIGVIPIDAIRFYTVEARRFAGYDDGIPGEAVVMHEVDYTRPNDAQVVDPDGNGDPNDAAAMWTVGETFDDAPNNIHVTIDSDTGTGYQVTIDRGSALFPDLVANALAGPASAAPGELVGISGTVANQGDGSSQVVTATGVYLSPDATITGSGNDIYVATVSTPILVAGGNAPLSSTVMIPAGVALGVYYLGGIVDVDERVFEDVGENNNAFTENTINVALSAPGVTTGGAYDVTDGGATLNGTVNPYGQTTNAWFEWGATTGYGNSTPIQAVGSGTTGITVSQALSGLTTGTTYHFRAVAQNATGTAYGVDRVFTTAAILDVDLVPTVVVNPSQMTVGSHVDVEVTAQNQGTEDSEQFAVSIYLSDTPDLTGNFVEINVRGGPASLPGGQSTVVDFTHTWVPAGSPLGNVYLVAQADTYDWVIETNESNNLLAKPVEVRAADLVVLDVTGPKSLRIGEPISGTIVIKNQGTDWTQTGFDIEFYLSRDNVITTDDIPFGTLAWSALLDGETRTINYFESFPIGVGKDTYYIGAIVDSQNVVVESDETNNTGVSLDTVRIR